MHVRMFFRVLNSSYYQTLFQVRRQYKLLLRKQLLQTYDLFFFFWLIAWQCDTVHRGRGVEPLDPPCKYDIALEAEKWRTRSPYGLRLSNAIASKYYVNSIYNNNCIVFSEKNYNLTFTELRRVCYMKLCYNETLKKNNNKLNNWLCYE